MRNYLTTASRGGQVSWGWKLKTTQNAPHRPSILLGSQKISGLPAENQIHSGVAQVACTDLRNLARVPC